MRRAHAAGRRIVVHLVVTVAAAGGATRQVKRSITLR